MSEYPWNETKITFTWLSSLYNPFKIPHNKLFKVLNELIDFCFKNVDEKYISVNKQAPDGRSTDNSVTLKRSSLKKALK